MKQSVAPCCVVFGVNYYTEKARMNAVWGPSVGGCVWCALI